MRDSERERERVGRVANKTDVTQQPLIRRTSPPPQRMGRARGEELFLASFFSFLFPLHVLSCPVLYILYISLVFPRSVLGGRGEGGVVGGGMGGGRNHWIGSPRPESVFFF